MARSGSRKLNSYPHAAPSRAFPDLPAPHATAAKQYIAIVNVPAKDDATSEVTVDYLTPPAAHATVDKTYALTVLVTGDDTTGGSTAVVDWTDATGLDFTP